MEINLACQSCRYRAARDQIEKWDLEDQARDVTRALWAVSLVFFAFCVTFTYPWQ